MSDKAYSRVKSSKLLFKGASKPKKVVKRQPDEAAFAHQTTDDSSGERGEREEEEEEEQIRILSGTGRITSSGTTIFGHETRFSNELVVGDAIVVSHPQSLVDETKIVRMVLSNVSISVSSAFSCDLVSTVGFRYVKAPKTKASSSSSSSSSSAGGGTEEEQRMRKLHQVKAFRPFVTTSTTYLTTLSISSVTTNESINYYSWMRRWRPSEHMLRKEGRSWSIARR